MFVALHVLAFLMIIDQRSQEIDDVPAIIFLENILPGGHGRFGFAVTDDVEQGTI